VAEGIPCPNVFRYTFPAMMVVSIRGSSSGGNSGGSSVSLLGVGGDVILPLRREDVDAVEDVVDEEEGVARCRLGSGEDDGVRVRFRP